MIRNFRNLLESFPALLILLGLLNGFAALFLAFPELPSRNLLFLLPIPGMFAGWFLLKERNLRCLFLFPVLAAVFVSLLILHGHATSYPGPLLDKYGCIGIRDAEFRLIDPSLCGGISAELKNAPRMIRAEAIRIFDDSPEGVPVSGSVLLIAPEILECMQTVGYGDLVRGNGYFERPKPPLLPGSFDLNAYTAARGDRVLFHAAELRIIRKGQGALRELYDFRGRFLTKLMQSIPDPETKVMAPALLFGIKQCIPQSVRQDFLASGTLHILSVSGFHVGLFFAILMLFLRPLPFRFRWSIAPVPVFLYALSTGMQAPALRAFIMFSVWCVLFALCVKTRILNTLFFTAAVILLWNPYQLPDIGFQYSFLCVLFLLLSAEFFRKNEEALSVRESFLAEKKHHDTGRLLRRGISAAGVSLAAWLCSMPVTLCKQGFFPVFAVPACLLMTPAAWLCFVIFVPALLFQWIPGVCTIAGKMMSPFLNLLNWIASGFADGGMCYVHPSPAWACVLFLCAFAGIFLFRSKSGIFASAVVLFTAGIICLWPCASPEIAVLRDGSEQPSIVFCHPGTGSALICNLPSGGTTKLAMAYLKNKGIHKIEEIHCLKAGKSYCGGINDIIRYYPARQIIFHCRIPKMAGTALAIERKNPKAPGETILKVKTAGSRTELIPEMPGFHGVSILLTISEDSGLQMELKRPGEKTIFRNYPYRTTPDIEIYPVRTTGLHSRRIPVH